MSGNRAARGRSLWVFGVASLAAVALGAFVMQQGGLPSSLWMRNAGAWIVAAGVGLFLIPRVRVSRIRLSSFAAPAALVATAASLIGPGQEGVHRWLDLGPVQLNAAALVLPLAIASFMRERARLVATCFGLIAFVLAWQPDRSQLAAFALAGTILSAARFGWRGAGAALLIATAAAALCLSRADPLEPVPHVEGIFLMAWTQSPATAMAMAAALGVAALSPLLMWSNARARWSAAALASYFVATSLAWLAGAYPVPLAGYGLSFVIGWWLGIASLAMQPKPP